MASLMLLWPLWPVLWPVLWHLLNKCQHWFMDVVTGDHGQVAVAGGQWPGRAVRPHPGNMATGDSLYNAQWATLHKYIHNIVM